LLCELADRKDVEAARARAILYGRLIEHGDQDPRLLAKADLSDLEVLCAPAPAEYKTESALRISRHFRERATHEPAKSVDGGGDKIGEPLGRFVLALVGSYFGEYASRPAHAEALDLMAKLAEGISTAASLKPEARQQWHVRAKIYSDRAADQRGDERPADPSPETRKFCEYDIPRHLEEAARASDAGARENASRGDPEIVLEWYLAALAHFAVARELRVTSTPSQENALAGQEMVVRCLSDLLCRDP
jgi:hypothetical protein